MDKKIAVGIGEVLWDMLPQGKRLGGAPANFAYHASQMGCNGIVASSIGRDALACEITRQLDGCGLDTVLQQCDMPTGTVQVSLDSAGIPSYRITENVAWDNIMYTPELDALAARCDCVCFGSLAQRSATSRLTISRFLDRMPADAIKVFDINIRQHYYSQAMIEESISKATILKINDEELELVTPMLNLGGSPDEKCRQLMGRYALSVVILTCGSKGSSVFTVDTASHLATPQVKVADTVGAGDSFTGAFCASLMAGMDISRAHRRAVDVAAYVCTCSGAMPKLPAGLTFYD